MSHHVLSSTPTDYSTALVLLSYIADQRPSNIIKFEFCPPLIASEDIVLQGYMELPINDAASITANHSHPDDVNEYRSASFPVEMVLLGQRARKPRKWRNETTDHAVSQKWRS
ncbi:hypothetical protein L7F22_056785 [Adiantum nelumboides]|nr:hypothetical protein [Adiantum nelumboides]